MPKVILGVTLGAIVLVASTGFSGSLKGNNVGGQTFHITLNIK